MTPAPSWDKEAWITPFFLAKQGAHMCLDIYLDTPFTQSYSNFMLINNSIIVLYKN